MKKVLLVIGIALCCLNQVKAEEVLDQEAKRDVFELGRILVTPSRLYEEYGQVARATNLITEEEIEDKNPERVSDLLTDLLSVCDKQEDQAFSS